MHTNLPSDGNTDFKKSRAKALTGTKPHRSEGRARAVGKIMH